MDANSLIDRMIGAAKLDVPTYEEIEHDNAATQQALVVVLIVAIAGAIGAIGQNGVLGVIGGLILAVVSWAVFSTVAYFVGTKMIPGANTEATIEQLLRCMGFAQVPGILGIFGFIPGVNILTGLIAFVWGLITAIIGLRTALEMSTGRAIAVGIISAIISGIIVFIVALPFGIAAMAA